MHQRLTWPEALMACCLLAISLASIILIPTWLYHPLSGQDLRGVSSPQVRIQLQQSQSQLANNARSTVLQLHRRSGGRGRRDSDLVAGPHQSRGPDHRAVHPGR